MAKAGKLSQVAKTSKECTEHVEKPIYSGT